MGSAERRLSRLRRQALAAYDAWQAAAGPWARWTMFLPLLGPGLDELPTDLGRPPQRRAIDALVQKLIAQLDPGGTRALRAPARVLAAAQPRRSMVVLDLAPEVGLRVAADLARRGLARPLVLIGRWPYSQAILPAQPVVQTAVAEARGIAAAAGPHLVVVLDAERSRPLPHRPARDRRADNRYVLVAEDFPEPAALVQAGIQRVLDVRAPRTGLPALLSRRVYPACAAAGLEVDTR